MGKRIIDPWTERLYDAVKIWCSDNGYRYVQDLRDELEIPHNKWDTIRQKAFTDTEYYARIFQRTGISEADPRKIPERLQFVPRAHKNVVRQRAWTEEQYQEWLSIQGVQDSAVQPMVKAESPKKGSRRARSPGNIPKTQSQERDPREILVAELRPFLAPLIAEEVRRVLGNSPVEAKKPSTSVPKNQPVNQLDVEELCLQLLSIFQAMQRGTKEQRTAFAEEYGQRIADLFALGEPYGFTDEEKRERQLGTMEQMSLGARSMR